MTYILLGNTLGAWLVALGIAAVAAMLLKTVHALVLRRLGQIAVKTETFLDDLAVAVLAATSELFLAGIGIYAGAQWLVMTPKTAGLLSHGAIVVLLLQVAHWGDVGIRSWLDHYRTRRSAEDMASTTSTAALGFMVRAALWLIIALMLLDNFGVNITTLIASLGIGGIAVALALQNILGDLFSSLSIVLDKPFAVGDFIIVDSIAGTVEYVGLKTTRIRSLDGEQIVFSNSDLLKSRIRNFQRMESRRVVFSVGITYETTEQQLERVPGILREIVSSQQPVRFDRAHFKSYGDSSLDFEVVYIIESADYTRYMDIQQAINLAMFKRFAREKIEFAYPTRTVKLLTSPPA